MFNFENKELVFYINERQIKIGPFSDHYFHQKEEKCSSHENFNSYDFRLTLMVSEAISKLEGIPLSASHQSGRIAYESWMEDGSFYKYYTVYSDYVDMHSIDMYAYHQIRKH